MYAIQIFVLVYKQLKEWFLSNMCAHIEQIDVMFLERRLSNSFTVNEIAAEASYSKLYKSQWTNFQYCQQTKIQILYKQNEGRKLRLSCDFTTTKKN